MEGAGIGGIVRVKDMYSDDDEFEELLESADSNASTEWEMQFVDDIRERSEKYGGDMFVSEKQIATLEKIARGDS